jgi:copper transport protein
MATARPAPRRRGVVAALAVAVLAALLLVVPAAPAQAHTFLIGSNPSDGELLQSAPATLRLDFSESVVLGATRVDVIDGHGKHHAPTGVEILAAAGDAADTEQPVSLAVTLPPLEVGTYRVAWKTLSSDDLHQASGVLAFGIGESVSAAGTVAEAPGLSEAAVRWVLWACLAGVVGPLCLAALAGRSLTGRRRDRLVTLARWAAVAQLAATVVLPAAQLRSVRQAWLAAQEPAIGGAWGVRALGALVVVVLVAPAVRAVAGASLKSAVARQPLPALALVAGMLAVPVSTAVRGHIWSTSHVLVAADVVHVLAAATWVGAVASLAVVHLGRGGERPVVRGKDFALLSGSCLAVAVATGLLLAGHGVSTTTALLRADYGRTLVVKTGLLAAVLVLALLNHRRGRADRVLGLGGRGRVLAEAGLLVAVLGAAGTLAATSPANSPQWTPAPAPSRSVTMHADDLLVQVSIGPNAPGPAYANISVLQTRRPAPAPVREVLLTLRRSGSTPVTGAATLQSDASWSLPVDLPDSGRWEVTVAAERMGLATASATSTWVVAGGVHGPPGTDLSRLTSPLALLVVVVWLTAMLVSARRRRQLLNPTTPDPTSAPRTTTIPPPIVVSTDVAAGCVPAQPTEAPAPPVNTVPPGELVLPTTAVPVSSPSG